VLDPTIRPSNRHELGRLLRACPRLTLHAGDVRTADNFSDAALLFVEAGIVVIASAAPTRRRIVLSFCPPGTLFPSPDSDEQVAALADSAVISLGPGVLRSLLQFPSAAAAIVDALLEGLRERQESLAQFSNVVHTERVRGKLLQLARAHGTAVTGGVRVQLPLTHELLGQAIGSARETVTAALGTLEREGFLVREGRLYRLMISPEILDSNEHSPAAQADEPV
jgi:CRP/FNR family transcriptional regulator, cyclic AMP receptor protein